MSAVAVVSRAPAVAAIRVRQRGFLGMPAWAAIGLIVCLVVVSHGYNMLHYPYIEDDEGTYFSQAWAVFHLGRLTPYTYFYDHVPLGWIQIGLWQLLAADLRFTYAAASGRVLMLLFQLGSALLVFGIARRCSRKIWVGLLAATLFSLSPIGIFFHRRILLDNVASFWILIGIYCLVGRVTLARVWMSGLALGIAVLSKEPALAVLPAVAVLVARQVSRDARRFATVSWVAIAGSVISVYPLLALLKGELFPPGAGRHPHVSLLCTLQWQAERGADGGILESSSAFWHEATTWAYQEPILVLGGSMAALLAVSVFRGRPVISALGWMVLSLWVFLGRGGVVLSFYVLTLLPLLTLCLALVAAECVSAVRRRARDRLGSGLAAGAVTLLVSACLVGVAVAYRRADTGLFTRRPVDAQVRAIRWIQAHIPPNSNMIIDMYMYADLHYPKPGAPSFPHAEYYWKAAEDPEINRGVFRGDWHNVQYVITTPALISDAHENGFPIVVPSLEHSIGVAKFDSGWEVEIRRVDPRVRVTSFTPLHHHQYRVPRCMTST
jgi:4-amino-4-deoxy-L-arabinose transferase-like glycosyltransferase